jgi:8-oxo-dGTP diphosphatase
VAGGVVRRASGEVLLVENERKDQSIDWSTPGGVVDAGESFVDALTREVREETGLQVVRWQGPLYRVEVTAPDLGFFLEVEAHGALDVRGAISVEDPDGIVLSAAYLTIDHASRRLEGAAAFVREPLLAHLVEGIDDGRTFAYRITGRGSDRRVERTHD